MKKILAFTITTIILASCGGGSSNSVEEVLDADVKTIRAKRTEVEEQLKGLEAQLAQLDSAIASNGSCRLGNGSYVALTRVMAFSAVSRSSALMMFAGICERPAFFRARRRRSPAIN